MTRLFRRIVLLSLIIYVMWVAFSFFIERFHSQTELNFLAWNGYWSVTWGSLWAHWIHYILWWIKILLWIVAAVGLYYLRRWGRRLYLAMMILDALMLLTGGFIATLPLDAFMNTILTAADGFIISMAYFSSVNNAFDN